MEAKDLPLSDEKMTALLADFEGEHPASRIYAVSAKSIGMLKKCCAKIHGDAVSGEIRIGEGTYDAQVLLFSSNLLEGILEKQRAEGWTLECRIGDTMYPMVALAKCEAEMVCLGPEDRQSAEEFNQSKLIDPIFDHTAVVADILGIPKIYLYPRVSINFHEVLPEKEGEIHIFIGMAPAQITATTHPKKILGVNVVLPDNRCYPLLKPLFGRGVLLTDGTQDVVQVIGSNYYFLFNPFPLDALGDAGLILFEKMLALALNSRCRDMTGEDTESPYDPLDTESVLKLTQEYSAVQKKSLKEQVAKYALDIAHAEHELRIQKRCLDELKVIQKHMNEADPLGTQLRTYLADDFPRILAHPLVRKARIIPGVGVEVRTNDVLCTHEEVCYILGRYVITVGIFGDIVIWTEHTYHPKGAPHPHISAFAGPCFGNAGDAISDAVAEQRIGDAFAYVLEWLADGYTPELVNESIEEWPRADEITTNGVQK